MGFSLRERVLLGYLSMIYRFWPASTLFPEYRIGLMLVEKYGCRSVLDVGCGSGNLGKILLKHGVVDKYVGVDVVDIFKVKDHRALFIKCDARNPPRFNEFFDCIFFINSIFYIGVDHLVKYIDYGKFIVIADIDPSIRYIYNKVMDLLEGRIRLPPDKLREKLVELGLEIIEEKHGAQYYIVASKPAVEKTIDTDQR